MPGAHEQTGTTDEFWELDLSAEDQALLDDAFERDRALRDETAAMFARLVELDLRDTFVEAVVRRLASLASSQPPVRAVMPALEDTLATARVRGWRRAADSRGQG